MPIKHALLALVLATTTLLAIGCGSSGTANGDGAATKHAPTFNKADVKFAQEMIPHHRQAIDMAQLALRRTTNPRIRQLAHRIEGAQAPEIAAMRQWLQAWGKPISGEGRSMGDGSKGMHHGDSMQGMSQRGAASMNRLESTTGRTFNHTFLTAMIKHHQVAIDMATVERAKGKNTQAVALAGQIQRDQAREIRLMHKILSSS